MCFQGLRYIKITKQSQSFSITADCPLSDTKVIDRYYRNFKKEM